MHIGEVKKTMIPKKLKTHTVTKNMKMKKTMSKTWCIIQLFSIIENNTLSEEDKVSKTTLFNSLVFSKILSVMND